MTLHDEFIAVSRLQLQRGRDRIESCLGKLSEEQIWGREHETENSVGNLVLHLSGNVRQWIVSGIGGEPDSRDRDAEFSRRQPLSTEELIAELGDALDNADRVLETLEPGALLETRKIQVYELTALHSVYHVVEHFSGHVGQIIWATKRMTGQDLGFYRYLDSDRGESPENAQP